MGIGVSSSGQITHEYRLRQKSIGFWEALAMSVEAMGPLLGALAVAPLIASQAGFSAPFMVLIAGVAMFMVALVIGRFSRTLPSAASIYTYISHGLGERVGFLSAWLSYLYYFMFEPLLLIGFGLFAQSGFQFVFGLSIAWYWWALLAGAIAFTLSILGIKLSMRVDLTLAVIADVVLLGVALAIIGAVIGKGQFTLEPFAPTHAPAQFTGLSLAIAFGVLIFLGFEQSFTLGEEVRDPHGDVPRAIYTSLALIGTLLLVATFAMVLGFGSSGIGALNDAFGKEGTPFWQLIRVHLSTPWRDALQIVAVTSILGNLIASHNAVVRIQYGMARARAFPGLLSRTSRRFRTPYVAILLQSGLSLLLILLVGLFWDPIAAFGFVGFLTGLAAVVAFIVIMVAAIRYFGRERPQDSAIRNYVIPAIGIVILLPAVYTSVYPNPGLPLSLAPWVMLAWLLIGVVYLIWRERRGERVDIDYAFRDIGEAAPGPRRTVSAPVSRPK